MQAKWLKHYDPSVPTHLDYPHIPLYQLLDDTASQNPGKPCVCFFGKWLTYGEVKDLSDRFAVSVQGLGIQKGDRVGLLLPNSPQFVIAYYGLLKAGAVIVPLNPLNTSHELTFHFQDANVETVITIPLFLKKVVELGGNTPLKRVIYSRLADCMPFALNILQGFQENRLIGQIRKSERTLVLADLQELVKQPLTDEFHAEQVDPDQMAVLIYSGGTTGIAKGIMLSHFNLVANAYQVRAWGDLKSDARILAVLPLFHGFGMSVNMNTFLLSGGEIVLMPRFIAKDVARAMQKYRPTIFIGVPTMFVALSNLPDIDRYDFSSLQGIFVGAAPLTRAIKDSFEAKTGGRMIEGYGLTEAVTGVMGNPYHGLHKLGSIGIPFSDVEAKIVSLDDGKTELPPCEQGEIVLRSPTLMLGYYHMPTETASTLREGWLYTGDIGYEDEDGYFYITDRKKELIIVGGFNVFPREIDELIYLHPKVQEGICVGLPDPYKGERIKVYAILKQGQTATQEEFVEYFRTRLVPYKVPSEVEFCTTLPKNAIGKILRRELVRMETERQGSEEALAGS